jgi:two-component system response regulator NreC
VAIKVLIADDHAVVRAGLRTLIHAEPDLVLVGEAVGGTEALELVKDRQPDVLLLDMSMADLDGITVTRQVKESQPRLHVLILTVHEDEALLRAALKAGASGYILKHAAEDELISAIHIVMRGDMYVDPAMLRSLLTEDHPGATKEQETKEALTPREREILGMIVQGYTNRQMGEELNISVRTVEGHRANISEKLGLHSRVELVRYARKKGLIEK